LGITLNMIIFILFLLSCLLLYSLLLVSIETKNFELGVIRMLGLNKLGRYSILLLNKFAYLFLYNFLINYHKIKLGIIIMILV
jgi:hypothetical protein